MYDIMNYQKIKDEAGNVTYRYLREGRLETGQLSMNETIIYWTLQKLDDQTKCCWTCIPCKENEIMMDSNTCKACAFGWWPNEEMTGTRFITDVTRTMYLYNDQRN